MKAYLLEKVNLDNSNNNNNSSNNHSNNKII